MKIQALFFLGLVALVAITAPFYVTQAQTPATSTAPTSADMHMVFGAPSTLAAQTTALPPAITAAPGMTTVSIRNPDGTVSQFSVDKYAAAAIRAALPDASHAPVVFTLPSSGTLVIGKTKIHFETEGE